MGHTFCEASSHVCTVMESADHITHVKYLAISYTISFSTNNKINNEKRFCQLVDKTPKY